MDIYSVGLTESRVKNILYRIGVLGVRVETHKNIRTKRTRSAITEHFRSLGMTVVFITPCELKPGEIAELIE